jgi:nicotinamidase-related amidase
LVRTADGAVLLLIDLQERLVPVIADYETVVARAIRLAEAATLLDVPIRATEQHPKGLGPTVPSLAGYPQAVMAKTAFSAAGDPAFAELLPPGGGQVVVAGVERAREHGAEIVTSEMVLFEWLRDAQHLKFREVHKLLR